MSSDTYIVSLDVGTSSVRTLLFDAQGKHQKDFGQQITYHITRTPDGGAEADPEKLLELCRKCLDTIHEELQKANRKPAAVAFDTFWHSFLGVDAGGAPVTPIVHLFDTRSTQQVADLERMLDAAQVHARTGCRLHTSYWPAKLLWLAQNRTDAFKKAIRWISFGEFLFLRLFGNPVASTSMVSGSGLWNQAANQYDEEVLSKLPISLGQVAAPEAMDQPAQGLTGEFRSAWPLLADIPWFPALGDGACNNIGSGCTTVHEFSLMVGTSGAMRAVIEGDQVTIPDGLWCYRVDRKRFVLGGALSNGGEVYAWMRDTLRLPSEEETERALAGCTPGSHGLVLLPFFAGERSPYWRADLRAAITGLNSSTKPIQILQAALESVSLRFREIYQMMAQSLGEPTRVIASGGALLASPAWSQMMADALARDLVPCLEPEATARGAALLASERLGLIPSVSAAGFEAGPPRAANPAHSEVFDQLFAQQRDLFAKLFT